MITYKITDQKTWDRAKVVDVNTSGMYQNGQYFHGTVAIEIEDKPVDAHNITGEHGPYDYEDLYGFILINK